MALKLKLRKQRLVVCVTEDQRRQIEDWVTKNQTTLTEFGRAALSAHIKNMKKLDQQQRLADTCQLFANTSHPF
ncbi:MAG TPA: hypothetical protein VGA99_07980 [bacterium]